MPITFGSVGDIISISLLIKDAVKALDDSRGSAHEYQGVIRELWSLDRVLLEVELLSRNYGQTAELNALCVTAKRVADETRKCVENFLERIKKYDARLGDHATKNGIRGVSMKIKWRLMEKDELDKFRAEISADRESMSFLLATASVNLMSLSSKQIQDRQMLAETQFQEAFDNQNKAIGEIQSRLEENTRLVRSVKSGVENLSDTLRLEWIRKMGSELKQFMGRIFFVNMAIYRTVVDIRALLPSQLERSLIQEPFLLEDAIGRLTPVHMQFIASWDAFDFVLETRFRNLQGYKKIVSKEFVLQERSTRRDISRTRPWEGAFLPGQRVDMSMVFADSRREGERACPGCELVNENCSEARTQCSGCGLWFGRVIELYDPEPSDLSKRETTRINTSATGYGHRVTKKISLGKAAPGQVVFGPGRAANGDFALQDKKRPFPGDESPALEDISRFKRVLMVHRQERVPKFISRPSPPRNESPENSELEPASYYDTKKCKAEQALEEKVEKLGPEHPDTILAMIERADVLRTQRKLVSAELLLGQAADLLRKMRNPALKLYSRTLHARINVAIDQNRLNVAEIFCRQLADKLQAERGPFHAETSDCRSRLAYIRQLQSKPTEETILNQWHSPVTRQTEQQNQNEHSQRQPDNDDYPITVTSLMGHVSGPISIGSNITRFVFENGRSYHSYQEGKYYLPNDEKEIDRMDMQHHAIQLVLKNELFLAPLQDPKCILDHGTGTGIWAMDVADIYPNATVLGTDLSPIQPNLIPCNCAFEINDMDNDWLLTPGSFDLVHSRFGNGFNSRNWDFFLEQSYNCLLPGGWTEIKDVDFIALSDDNTLPPDSAIVKWHNKLAEGAALGNLNLRLSSSEIEARFAAAGFINITVKQFKIPIGAWPKDKAQREIGTWQLAVLAEGLEAFSLAIFTRLLNWSKEAMDELLAEVHRELRHKSFHWYWPFITVYGQKPPAEDNAWLKKIL